MAHTFTAAEFPFTDQDGDQLLAVRVATLPARGTLTLSGSPVVAGQLIPVADINLGNLEYSCRPPMPTARRYSSFTFQVQGQRRHGQWRRDLDPTAQYDDGQRHGGQRCAGGADTTAISSQDQHEPHVQPGRLRLQRPERQPGQHACWRSRSRGCRPAARLLDNGSGGDGGTSIVLGQPTSRPASWCLRRRPSQARLRQLHLPGAGQRRHGQRRRRYSIRRPNDDDQRSRPRSTMPRPAPTRPSRRLEDMAYTVRVGRLRLHRSERSARPTTLLAVKITTLPAVGTLTLERHGGHGRSDRSAADVIGSGQLDVHAPANANGDKLASFTFQVQDDGGTANGGVDLDHVAEHADLQRHRGQRSRRAAPIAR